MPARISEILAGGLAVRLGTIGGCREEGSHARSGVAIAADSGVRAVFPGEHDGITVTVCKSNRLSGVGAVSAGFRPHLRERA